MRLQMERAGRGRPGEVPCHRERLQRRSCPKRSPETQQEPEDSTAGTIGRFLQTGSEDGGGGR